MNRTPQSKPAPAAPAPHVVFPATVNRVGDGFIVSTGKPLLWLSPRQAGAEIGVNQDTIYRWIKDGTLPRKLTGADGKEQVLVERTGIQKWKIHAAAIPWLKAKFAALRDTDAAENLKP